MPRPRQRRPVPHDARERSALTDEEAAAGIRMACMVTVLGDAEITLPERGGEKILTAGVLPAFPLEPLGRGLGVAVDIGTTTLAAYLYDLRQGVLWQPLPPSIRRRPLGRM